jgi:hypothetical protein
MINPYIIIAILVAFIGTGAGGFGFGWKTRGDHDDAIALQVKTKADQELDAERKRADGLSADLELEKRNIKTVTVEVVKEIPKVTTVYVEKPNETPRAIPPAVVTWGSVRLFNSSLRPDLPNSAGEFAYPAGATDITRAQVDIPDILNVHAVNASKYAECRAQLNKLIDYEEGLAAKALAR